MYRYMLLAALCAVTNPAYAGEVGEIQATSIDLGGFRGVVYYTSEAGGYRVIATIAEGENGLPVRLEATLLDGQKVTVSVPGKLGEDGHSIEMMRSNSKLIVGPSSMGSDSVVDARP
jgi:hypothetical protein